jgi:hypothetical protein
MRCPICDAHTDGMDPCGECQDVIYETLLGYEDPETDEDPIIDEEFDFGC